MKSPITPTDNELFLPDDGQIISKTNENGLITYCNTLFIEFSGYDESELLGQPHNVIRHPDMPRAIFHLFWETLQKNQEFNGYIKNLCKDGSFYWVFANVTPSMSQDNQLLGYYSVRRKASDEQLSFIKDLYQDLKEIENKSSDEKAIQESTYKLNNILNGKEVGYNEFILNL